MGKLRSGPLGHLSEVGDLSFSLDGILECSGDSSEINQGL